jgi:hypothetical protein
MKYFIDTEFIEGFHKSNKRLRHHIDLISIGIVCEDGRELHLISREYEYRDANDWVKQNVIEPMYVQTVHGDARNEWNARTFHKGYGFDLDSIKTALIKFFEIGQPCNIEVYGYYSDYDWVVFCSIFGTMMDLPKTFPMYCLDLKQMMKERGLSKEWKKENCPDPEGEHNALVDAKWNRKLYKLVSSIGLLNPEVL